MQPFLLRVPILLRLKESIKQTYFFKWRGKHTDVYIVSFPKSGRTWLKMLLGKTIAQLFDINDKKILNIFEITRDNPIPGVQFTHDGTDQQYARSYQNLVSDKTRFLGKKVVLLVREPRDLVVSNYFQATRRENAYKGDISIFIRDPRYGIKKILMFYKDWNSEKSKNIEKYVVRYEDLHSNTCGELEEILAFIGIPGINRKIVETAVDFSSFNNMKKLEQGGFFNQNSMRPGNRKDKGSYKVRKGKIGSYVDELSQDDLKYIQDAIQDIGSHFYEN